MPRFIDLACGVEAVTEQRKRIVGLAEGRVLEVGFGSGFNLPLYDPRRVERVMGVEPPDRRPHPRSRVGHRMTRVGLHPGTQAD